MSKFWSPGLDGLTPYTPGEQPRQSSLIKLNTNESPFGPSPAVTDVLRAWPVEQLRRYPDPDSTALCNALAREHGVRVDNVFVGNGSDEVLAHTFCALLRHDRPILMPDVTYAFYRSYCALYGIAYKAIPLDSEYRIDVSAYEVPCGGVVLANPNAPTGIALARADIERLLVSHPDQVVVVDEAYVDFGGESAIKLTDRYPNLLVVRTFSKSRGLAGIRVGYALGHAALIGGLNRVKNSFNSYPVSSLSAAAAIASLGDTDHFANTVAEIIRLRQLVAGELGRLGMLVLPSSANFLFATHPAFPASRLLAGLRQNGVLVRHFVSPRTENFLRITIGSESDCSALVMALRKVLSDRSG